MAVTGCSSGGNDEKEITALMERNVQAAQRNDIAAYMSTIHTSSPGYAETEATMKPIFVSYHLKYTISDIKVDSVTGDDAVAHATILTEAEGVGNPPFQNNKIIQKMDLKKEGGEWKIYNSVMEKVELVK